MLLDGRVVRNFVAVIEFVAAVGSGIVLALTVSAALLVQLSPIFNTVTQ
jgi:hypothetical protein